MIRDDLLAGWLAGRLVVIAAFIGLWQIAATGGWIDTFFFSSPREIAGVIGRWLEEGRVFGNLGLTLAEAAIGYVIGVAIGTALGFAFAFLPRVAQVFDPFRPDELVPAAYARASVHRVVRLRDGAEDRSGRPVHRLHLLLQHISRTAGGRQGAPDRARLFGASRWQITQHIYLPAAFSWIIAGLRASVGFALIGAVVGEYIGGDAGVGFLIMQGQHRLRIARCWLGSPCFS